MSLYYEAAKVLEDIADGSVSLKQRVYNDKSLKSSPGAVYALVSEASKWSSILSEVIDKSEILKLDRKLTPTLSLVLVHDLLLSKKGLSASKKHPLFDAISKQKARLTSELTRIRIRRGFPTLESLLSSLRDNGIVNDESSGFYPRWVRINTMTTTQQECLATTFKKYEIQTSLKALKQCKTGLYIDEHIPNLVAIHPSVDLTKTSAYRDGHIILQDKASCFPAYLLDPPSIPGSIIDGCAAPGNKTTHLAAILSEHGSEHTITACERDKGRAQTLSAMVGRAHASSSVSILAGQDFLQLKPADSQWASVSGILLDPSCSGSGIVGRDAQAISTTLPAAHGKGQSRKRKRESPPAEAQEQEDEPVDEKGSLEARLTSLSNFQLRMVEHAMLFANVTRITYSTCSVHGAENEGVAARALASAVARERGWRLLRREEQVDGMRRWERRGDVEVCRGLVPDADDAEELAQACIRAEKGTEEGTMGFFVVGFTRDESLAMEAVSESRKDARSTKKAKIQKRADTEPEDTDDWVGFSD